MAKTTRARYTLEFKEEAVRSVAGGQRVAAVAKALGLAEETLHNWVKAAESGGLKGSAAPKVSAEQMEISRLRTELARVKMERDILKGAAAYLEVNSFLHIDEDLLVIEFEAAP